MRVMSTPVFIRRSIGKPATYSRTHSPTNSIVSLLSELTGIGLRAARNKGKPTDKVGPVSLGVTAEGNLADRMIIGLDVITQPDCRAP